MNASLSRFILTPVLAVALFTMCNTALAQGTATGPFTAGFVTPGPEVLIGDPNNPIPIDLDPNGLPWSKSITDPNGLVTDPAGELLDMIEFIENVGTESWGDWHEHIAPNGAGLPDSTWISVDLLVNGSSITFNALGLGTPNLWLDTFSQPVLPGDILEIRKVVEVFPVVPTNSGPILRIEEYPTPIPEPGSLVLAAVSSLVLIGMRRRR